MNKIEYKFYYTNYGCMGYIGNDKYQLFSTEDEYSGWWSEQ